MNHYKEYFAIETKIKKQGFDIVRSDVIKQFTSGRKQGLSQLSNWEYRELLSWLNKRFGNGGNNATQYGGDSATKHCVTTTPFNEKEDRQKKKIIALFCNQGWTKDGKADIYRINGWAMKYGHLHKKLNDYHGADLTKLVSQAEEAWKTYVDGLSK
jgi:hypothetical protein